MFRSIALSGFHFSRVDDDDDFYTRKPETPKVLVKEDLPTVESMPVDRLKAKVHITPTNAFLEKEFASSDFEVSPEMVNMAKTVLEAVPFTTQEESPESGGTEADVENSEYSKIVDALTACVAGGRPSSESEVRRATHFNIYTVIKNCIQGCKTSDTPPEGYHYDLFLTAEPSPDESNTWKGKLFAEMPGILISVYPSTDYDLRLGETSEIHSALLRTQEMIVRQFVELPYRFIYSISITGNVARIWKWSQSECKATEPIYFKSSPEPLLKFFHHVCKDINRVPGLDVGDEMTFQRLQFAPFLASTFPVRRIWDIYDTKSGGRTREMDSNMKKMWIFELSHHLSEGELENFPDAPDGLLVFPVPISVENKMFQSEERSYLAMDHDFALSAEWGELSDQDIKSKLRTLKLSFQTDTNELSIYEDLLKRKVVIPHLATLLAGGSIKEGPIGADADKAFMNWFVYKEVAVPFTSVPDKECVQAFGDIVKAHRLLTEAGILHRNINQKSIMVNLSDNRGLLSGLDEARNDHDPEMDFDRLEMETQIGTEPFLSIALEEETLNCSWHDLESMFWVLLEKGFRSPSCSYNGRRFSVHSSVKNALERVLVKEEASSKGLLEEKRTLLREGRIKMYRKELHSLVLELKALFFGHYEMVDSMRALLCKLADLEQVDHFNMDIGNVLKVENSEKFKGLLSDFRTRAEKLKEAHPEQVEEILGRLNHVESSPGAKLIDHERIEEIVSRILSPPGPKKSTSSGKSPRKRGRDEANGVKAGKTADPRKRIKKY